MLQEKVHCLQNYYTLLTRVGLNMQKQIHRKTEEENNIFPIHFHSERGKDFREWELVLGYTL